jgi:hypothetical protein
VRGAEARKAPQRRGSSDRIPWKTLSAYPQYRDNVSAITDIILQPTPTSQI